MKRNRKSFLWLAKTGVVSALACVSANVPAAEIEAAFRVGYGISDNLGRDAVNLINDDMRLAGFTLNLNQSTRRFTAQVRSNFDFISYASDTFGEEFIGGLDAFANLALVEERINWVFEANYGQRLFDPFVSANPRNRENLGIVSTGPSFDVSFAERMFVRADIRFSKIDYQISNFDNNVKLGQLAIGRQMGNDAELSLNITKRRVKFDGQLQLTGYDVNEVFLSYEFGSSRSAIVMDAGLTDIKTATNSSSGVVTRFSWNHVVTPTSTFALSGGSQYSDEGNIFQFMQNFSRQIGNTVDAQGRDIPFRRNTVIANYEMLRERTQFDFSAGWVGENYEFGNASDRDIFLGEFFVRRELTREIFAQANIQLRGRDYKYIDRNDKDTILSTGIGYQFTPAFSVTLTYLRYDRNSTAALDSYTENRGFIIFTFTPPWGRQVLRQTR